MPSKPQTPFLPKASLAAGLAALCAVAPVSANRAAGQTAAPVPTAEPAAIDPVAIAALDDMAAYLQTLASFRVRSDTTSEVVLESGQKIQFGGEVDLAVHRPDAFKVVSQADTRTREMYYDGESFTIFAPRLGYYASFDAPPTIGQTLDAARTRYGIEVPLADLFTWGTDQTIRSRIREAMVILPETVGGRRCIHYAFRQDNVDWQLWLEDSETPLPCKLVITSTDDPSMPQYSSVLHWDLAAPVAAEGLAFDPPADAHRITIADVEAAAGEER